jgi:hypothetical protein
MPRQLPLISAILALALFQLIPARAAHEWVVRYTNNATLVAIAAGNGQLVAVGNTDSGVKTLWSENGVDWQAATPQAQSVLYGKAVAFSSGKFVVGGSKEFLMISQNGRDWTMTHLSDTNNAVWDIRWFDGAYIALARTSLLRSVDGFTWERIPTPGIFYSMGILNGQLVLQGPDQGMQASADLVNWRRLRQPEFPNLLFSANDLLFYGYIMSRDGLDWHFLQYAGRNVFVDDVVSADGRTLVLSGGEIFDVTFGDAATITKIDALHAPISKMICQDGRLFGASFNGSIMELASLSFVRASKAGGQVQIDASGPTGRRVRIDSSEDMVNWVVGTTVLTLPAKAEPADSSGAQRFYRATFLE